MSTPPDDSGNSERPEPAALRLGFGEFIDGFGYLAMLTARQHFLDAVAETVPSVLEDLQGDPLRLAQQIWEPSALHGGDASDALIIELLTLIEQWRLRWHLGTEEVRWVDGTAWWTLIGWVHQEVAGQPLTQSLTLFPENAPALLPAVAQLFGLPQQFPLLVDPTFHGGVIFFPPAVWNPRIETRAAATERIIETLRLHLASQMDQLEEHQRDNVGDTSAPMKRSGRDHFLWLARYQVEGVSFQQIAREAYREPQTVYDAINQTADLINLPLRTPSRGGRPRKRPEIEP